MKLEIVDPNEPTSEDEHGKGTEVEDEVMEDLTSLYGVNTKAKYAMVVPPRSVGAASSLVSNVQLDAQDESLLFDWELLNVKHTVPRARINELQVCNRQLPGMDPASVNPSLFLSLPTSLHPSSSSSCISENCTTKCSRGAVALNSH